MNKILYIKVAGFTLIEALIAALIVGVGMLGLAKLQGELFISNSESRMRTHALNLAQDKIEEFRKVANKNKYDEDFIVGSIYQDTKPAGSGSSSTNFIRRWEIINCPNSVTCKQISVTVIWTDSKGVNQNVQLTSNVAGEEAVKTGILLASQSTTTSASTTTTASSTTTTTASTSTTATPTTTTVVPTTTTNTSTTTSLPSTTTTTVQVGGACTGLITAAIVSGSFTSANNLSLGTPFRINTNPLAVCTIIALNSLLNLPTKTGTYICSIENLNPAIVALSVGGKTIDLSVNLAISDIQSQLPMGGLITGQINDLQNLLDLPPDLVCAKANVDLPITLDSNLDVTIQ